jgi:catecholate siderophore receptor
MEFSRMRRLLWLALALLLVSFTPADARAHDPALSISGVVLDPSRAPVPGAIVSAVPAGAGRTASAATDQRGQFTLLLDPGSYTITVAADGFVRASFRIEPSDDLSQPREIVLEVAAVRETVHVTAPARYQAPAISSATRTMTPLRDVPQSVTVVTRELVQDQLMSSVSDVVRYVPGVTAHQGENNRDQVVLRGNSSSADFFVNGVRDDVQYYRDLSNLERLEALKGPNALMFGRGGGGGVINRVTKEPMFQALRDFSVQAGGYGNRRFTADLDQAISGSLAVRLNGMFERADSFRDEVEVERSAINPTVTIAPGPRTRLTFGYEHLRDTRVADRGITSVNGRPAGVDRSTFFGNPADSHVRLRVNVASANLEHRAQRFTLRSRTLVGGYDRFYQNYVPGAVSADQSLVALTAYNNASDRTNVFSQADATTIVSTGRVRHTLIAGGEVGRQETDNFRMSGFFDNVASSVQVPLSNPTIDGPVAFRQNATDADNNVRATVAAVFVQDQVELSPRIQLLGGLRFDRFDLRYRNNRSGETLDRTDHLVSPRAAVTFKPVTPLSIYGSYGVSYLPSSGDQFASLTAVTQQLEPERFDNYEIGLKWDALPGLSVTSAAYRLDRLNSRSTDPNDPTRIVQTGSQRTNGFELGLNGRVTRAWRIAGGYAFQDAVVTRATTVAREGAIVAQVPRHTLSLWNNYQLHPRVAASLGLIHSSDTFAAIDNTVILPAYTRIDAGTYVSLTKRLRLQGNVENLFDEQYFPNANNNTNITPGSPRVLRVAMAVTF